eukprot:scaffold329647_cov95-Tisochrysis_lutea.AAC.3
MTLLRKRAAEASTRHKAHWCATNLPVRRCRAQTLTLPPSGLACRQPLLLPTCHPPVARGRQDRRLGH